MKRQMIRNIINTVSFGLGLLLFAFLAANLLPRTAHTFCPYALVCFGAFTARPDITAHFFIGAILGGAVVLLLTLFLGRVFCGYVCPLGTLQEYLAGLRRGRFSEKLSPRVHKWLIGVKYLVLMVTLELAWAGLQRVYLPFCPVYSLAHPAGIALGGAVVLAFIVFAGWWVERGFCRYLCPFGALQGLFVALGNRLHLHRWRIRRGYVGSLKCRNCPNYCPLGIDLGEQEEITSPECIVCGRCIRQCAPGDDRSCIYGQMKFPPRQK
jgi:polyferredoxin